MVLNGYCQKDCINGLTKEDAQHVKEIPLIEESIDGINSHIGNMSSDIEDLQVASINFADHFDTLDGKVSTLETGLSDLDDWVTEINNTTIANLSTQVNTLENSTIPGINARLLTIEDTQIPDINDAIDDLDDRVTVLENGGGGGTWSYVTSLYSQSLLNQGLVSSDSGIITMLKDILITFKIGGIIKNIILPKNFILPSDGNLFDFTITKSDLNFSTSHNLRFIEFYITTSTFFKSWASSWKFQIITTLLNLDSFSDTSISNIGTSFNLIQSPIGMMTPDNSITIMYKN